VPEGRGVSIRQSRVATFPELDGVKFFRVFPVSRDNIAAMKSAYELAMERLAKSDPDSSRPLTPEQKSQLAEIDRVYKGRLAEREIFLQQQLDGAYAAQKFEEAEKIKQQLSSERARIEEEREAEKERIRQTK
jgi:hypothetical protein